MNIEVKILRNEQSKPAGLLADAEIHFLEGELAGLKLVGFAIWERRDGNGRRVTFPGRPLIVHGDKRSFELLDFSMLLKKLIEQHRVDRVVAHRVRVAILIAYHETRVYI